MMMKLSYRPRVLIIWSSALQPGLPLGEESPIIKSIPSLKPHVPVGLLLPNGKRAEVKALVDT
jgi:hypothetical protein